MTNTNQPTLVLSHEEFDPPSVPAGTKRVLLLNPPVYDAQYWARWSQPAGLLRIATLLKSRGYMVDLIDCMETDQQGYVKKIRHRLAGGVMHDVMRDDVLKRVWHFGLNWNEIRRRMLALEPPDEVWIGSIMTYWWESTRDAVELVRHIFPRAQVIVGGIYPTLAPEHASTRLGADIIFKGELPAASHLPIDLSFYETRPSYAILATTRGCPWDCHYCAARALNSGSNKMRWRSPEDVLEEIEYKMQRFGIRRFGFYEDNALSVKGHLQKILELIIERGHKLELYAPEGFETRLLTEELLRTMKLAGFEKVHLPFEALRWDTNLGWNRRHASTASFEQALSAAIRAGFKPRTTEINAFVLFGLPDDKLEDILDSVVYIHHMVGSIIPMLFTPVPGTQIYREHADYLHKEMGWDLQDLNGKFLPFLEYNRRHYSNLRASDYLELEALMSVLNNGKFLSRALNLCDEGMASRAFRAIATCKEDLSSAMSDQTNGKRPGYLTDISDEDWQELQPILIGYQTGLGRPSNADFREVWNAIAYKLRTNCTWKELPDHFASRSKVQYYYGIWKQSRILDRATKSLRDRGHFDSMHFLVEEPHRVTTLNSKERNHWNEYSP